MAKRLAIDLTGQRFGRLFVESRAPNNKRSEAQFNCLCDCGARKVVRSTNLRSGETKSCGCLKSEQSRVNGRQMQAQRDKQRGEDVSYEAMELARKRWG